MKKIICAIAVAGLTVSAVLFAEITYAEEYTMAIIPRQSAKITRHRWMPIAQTIQKATGVHVAFTNTKKGALVKFYPTIAEFEQAALNNEFDIVYVNPWLVYQLTKEGRQNRYTPLIRKGGKLKGILVVGKNSAIQSISDLSGKKIAFPRNAFAADKFLQANLLEKGIEYTAKYTNNHDNSYRTAAFKYAAAGGGVPRTFNAQPDWIKAKLRVIYTTPGTPAHGLIVSPRVKKSDHEKIIRALLKLHEQSGKMFNKAIKNPQRASYADYATLEKYSQFIAKAMAKSKVASK